MRYYFLFVIFFLSLMPGIMAQQTRCMAMIEVGRFPDGLKISSSSNLRDGMFLYRPDLSIDYNFKTAWCEGKKDDGIGEWIQYNFKPASLDCGELFLMPGIATSMKLYNENNRIKELVLTINYLNGPSYSETIHLPENVCTDLDRYCKMVDEAREQHYGIEELPLNECKKKYSSYCIPPILAMPYGPDLPGFRYYNPNLQKPNIVSIRFSIKSVYRGSKYQDTCLTEVIPLGNFTVRTAPN